MRTLSPYEFNLLVKYGLPNIDLSLVPIDIPIEYIIGKAEFYDKSFFVNPNVLIPRIETEKIITESIEYIRYNKYSRVKIADIATGSGCIGISLFLELKKLNIEADIFLSDISSQALEVTRKNITEFIKSEDMTNIHLLKSDLFLNFPFNIKFDLIVSNLPYIPTERIKYLNNSVKNFEPILALDGGKDGLVYINKILKEGKNFLNQNGQILLEIDDSHKMSFFDVYKDKYSIGLIKDLYNKDRFLKVCPI